MPLHIVSVVFGLGNSYIFINELTWFLGFFRMTGVWPDAFVIAKVVVSACPFKEPNP